jgi:signal transduction histidine kinase/CheY-like chemotaxis protein/AraC-like DNA-binding protein
MVIPILMNKIEKLVKPISRISNWLNEKLNFQGADRQQIQVKKVFVAGYFIAGIGVVIMTLLTLQLGIFYLLPYGLFLVCFYLIFIPWIFFARKGIEWLCFAGTMLLILGTFYFTLKLGGLINSHGIVMLKNRMMIIVPVIVYFITLLLSGILQPGLTLPQGFSPVHNLIFFTINTIWISGFMIVFIYVFIAERSRAAEEEAQKLKMLDEARTRLFINVTHEFRTPLTVILGLAGQLKIHSDPDTREGLEKITQNGKRLLHLVNQMLDFSKVESGAMPVRFIQGDIIGYLKYLIEIFQPLAAGNHLSLRFESPLLTMETDFEPDKLMHILSNLISNSIKFTPQGGEIILSARIDQEKKTSIHIDLIDNGIGIPAHNLNNIFDRFYQVGDNGLHHTSGSGLGLALTKELVKLIGGEITVESTEKKGTVFSIILPVTNSAPRGNEIITGQIENYLAAMNFSKPAKEEMPAGEDDRDSEFPLLLIVEDNADVVYYLSSLLGNVYAIEVSGNGEEGLKKAIELTPDIIISDVMMPVMDGFEMVGKLKNDIRTSHIPIVLLTARADMDSRVEGLERGADAYLAKPFNEPELMTSLRSLIELRKKLRQRYSSLSLHEPAGDKSLQYEDSFMKQVLKIVEKNYQHEDLSITRFCQDLGMSRSQVYRKFKALSDKTLSGYIRSYRLSKARELLKTTRLNVTQIAFEVGFKNLSHFSHTFLDEFGVSPSEIRDSVGKAMFLDSRQNI